MFNLLCAIDAHDKLVEVPDYEVRKSYSNIVPSKSLPCRWNRQVRAPHFMANRQPLLSLSTMHSRAEAERFS
ncbi:MAG: hypothetical protein DWH96_03850 [Planctomycetota bacterium]|nr:MAG: hypothetical protein DWH96_03850 [Planctomycetota bacterium]RLS91189.1 MAG: hypothetical protein DWI11_11820 [Planctomycetota bacterium]